MSTTTTKVAKLSPQEIEKMPAISLPEDKRIEKRFVQLYNGIHGDGRGELIYNKEKFNFMKLVSDNKQLQVCTKLSLYACFMDAAVNGLSLEQQGKPHAYIIPYNTNTGTKDSPKWEKRASFVISPMGELVLRMRAGHIKYADDPVIVYEGDKFKPGTDENGKKNVEYAPLIPRKEGAKIIGGFIRIVRTNDEVDFFWMLTEDVERLRKYSEKQNRGKANDLYTSFNGQIDPGFFKAKIIKHAFSTYPRMNIGKWSALATEKIDEEPLSIDYGIEEEDVPPTPETEETQTTQAEPVTQETEEEEGGF